MENPNSTSRPRPKFSPEQLKALGFEFKSNAELHEGMSVIIDEFKFRINNDLELYVSHTYERKPDHIELIEDSKFVEIFSGYKMISVTTIDTIEKIDQLIKCLLGIEPMSINSLCREAHTNSKKSGFWNDIHVVKEIISNGINQNTDVGKGFSKRLIEFIDANDTNSKLMLICGEVAEASEALRKGFKRSDDERFSDMFMHFEHLATRNEAFTEAYNLTVKGSFDEELADIVIRVFDLAGRHNVDLQRHINMKMTYNSYRPKKHGKLI